MSKKNKTNLRMRICSCGRIHFYDGNRVYNAIAENKEVLFICGGCGRATRMGADDWTGYYDNDEPCYAMYSQEVDKDTSWTADAFEATEQRKAFSEIIYSTGKKVMMKTGYYAKAFHNDEFEDIWYPDFYKLEHPGVAIEEVFKFIEENRTLRKQVNMNWLVRELTEEEAKLLHRAYYIKAFDWSQTKYGPQKF